MYRWLSGSDTKRGATHTYTRTHAQPAHIFNMQTDRQPLIANKMKSTLNGKTLCEYLSPLYKSISCPVAQDKSKEIWERCRNRKKMERNKSSYREKREKKKSEATVMFKEEEETLVRARIVC